MYVFLVSRTLDLDSSKKLLRTRIRDYIQGNLNISLDVATSLVPDQVDIFGKMQGVGGGNMIHASESVPIGASNRDMTWARVCTAAYH